MLKYSAPGKDKWHRNNFDQGVTAKKHSYQINNAVLCTQGVAYIELEKKLSMNTCELMITFLFCRGC